MEIKHTDGKVIDTNKLGDIESMILEKCEELRKICLDNNRQMIAIVDSKGDRSSTYFWNLKMEEGDGDEIIHRSYDYFWSRIDKFVRGFSKGSLILGRPNPNESYE